jgi:hypothetical protein
MDDERPWLVRRQILGPVDNELLRARIEIAFAEG